MSVEFIDVIPVVVYDDIAAAHDFLVDVLGFSSAGLERDPAGTVVHGEVRAGERRVWLHTVSDEFNLSTPRLVGQETAGVSIHVVDVDAHFERVRAAGAHIIHEPQDEDYGERGYGVLDPEGHSWWFATPFAPPAGR